MPRTKAEKDKLKMRIDKNFIKRKVSSQFDEHGLITQIGTINRDRINALPLFAKPIEIKRKLDFYRTFFNKIHDLSESDYEVLKINFETFFNTIPFYQSDYKIPQYLYRISNNNAICGALKKPLSYFTDLNDLLAPPLEKTIFGRCNLKGQQVLYCSEDLVTAYWETKPQKGDIITISRYELKEGAEFDFLLFLPYKESDPLGGHSLREIYTLLNDFIVDIYTLEIQSGRPRDYLFSALISSTFLFPIKSDLQHKQAIIYGSVQRSHNGANFAIKNDAIFKYYNLMSTETKFVTNGFNPNNPSSTLPPIDFLFASLATLGINLTNKKIQYEKNADELFRLFRNIQMDLDNFKMSDNFINKLSTLNVTPKKFAVKKAVYEKNNKSKFGRNDRVNVVYPNGVSRLLIKFKFVEKDLNDSLCKLID